MSHYIFRRRSYPARAEPSESKGSERPIRFAVRSLGWVEIAEEDLTPERSSKAVNKCIVDLSFGRFDLLDVVGRWGDVSILVFHITLAIMFGIFMNLSDVTFSFPVFFSFFFLFFLSICLFFCVLIMGC